MKVRQFTGITMLGSVLALSVFTSAHSAPAGKLAQTAGFAKPLPTAAQYNRLIIKFKTKANTASSVFDFHAANKQVAALDQNAVLSLSRTTASSLRYRHSITSQTHVALTSQPMSRAELYALAKQLEQDPSVAYAEIDEIRHPLLVPNDPGYTNQWHYRTLATFVGGANLPTAWDLSTGAGVVVAVIDTGVRPHADLVANLLPGFDFISADSAGVFTTANDGDGRDTDASDPGDWTAANQCAAGSVASDSSWHGTHVAGTVAAVTNNNAGVAGVAFGAKILPLRALGVCGGFTSDIAAGMLWAAGLNVPGVPANLNKAKILNLSLGGSGACSATEQDTVTAVRAAGSVVVAATGNDGNLSIGSPANCTGVIAVTSHTKTGDNSDFANIGAGTTISGPGGGTGSLIPGDGAQIYSTYNSGTTSPLDDLLDVLQGTSMATPHVAGVAALLASLQPNIRPDTLTSVLTSSARAHPAGSFCATRTDCGAGLLDARAALDRLVSLAPTVAAAASPTGIQHTGTTLSLTATPTGHNGSSVFSYQWTQTAGVAVSLSNATNATASFVAPTPGSSYTFKVTVTDGTGLTANNQVSVTTNTAPVLNAIPAQTVLRGSSLSFTATAIDAESNVVVFVASGLPAGSTLDAATGTFTWNNAGPAGAYSFTLTPDDGVFGGTPQTVTIHVTEPTAAATATGGGGGGCTTHPDGADGSLPLLLLYASIGLFLRQRLGKKLRLGLAKP